MTDGVKATQRAGFEASCARHPPVRLASGWLFTQVFELDL